MGDAPTRTLRPVAAKLRPLRRRATARVLLVNDADQVLLFADTDPGVPGSHWWMTPGGEIEPGESELSAALREVAEETGIRLSPSAVLGPIARRSVEHGYSDVVIEQTDVFFTARVLHDSVDTSGQTHQEQQTLTGYAWFDHQRLGSTTETIWPTLLPGLLRDALAWLSGEARPERPLEHGVESTVPVSAGHLAG